jgi:GDP-L-fucose synthase
MEDPIPINLGTGREIVIRDLMGLVAQVTGFTGEVRWDSARPDGQPRRCLDMSRARQLLGWEARVGLEEGLRRTVAWHLLHRHHRAIHDPSSGA